MKKINRKIFEDLIRFMRKYNRTGDTDILDKRTNCCYQLERETGVGWLVFGDLSSVLVDLKMPNEKIEDVMNLLGFELVEGEEVGYDKRMWSEKELKELIKETVKELCLDEILGEENEKYNI